MLILPPVPDRLVGWAAECSNSLAEAFEVTLRELEKYSSPDVEYPVVLRRLLGSCQLSSESVLILISNNKLWDAETVLRSAIEGTAKYVYLCIGDEATTRTKFNEYYNDLSEINRLKRHQRLTQFLAHVSNPDDDEWRPFRDLLLMPEEYERLETSYPRNLRKQMEHRWSFHAIVNSFSQSGIDGLELFRHLFYGYGQGSHILHQDSDGVNVLWERYERGEERRTLVELTHGARELGDLIVMAFLRYLGALHLGRKPIQPAIDFFSNQQALFDQFSHAREKWHEIEYPK